MRKLIAIILLGLALIGMSCTPKKAEEGNNANGGANASDTMNRGNTGDLFDEGN